jgi:hypothetical protein
MAPNDADTLPQPVVSLAEIDEALVYTWLNANRDDNWRRWADALLDQRNRMARNKD